MRYLPNNGQVTLEDLASALATAEPAHAIPSRVLFRAVVVQDSEGRFRLFLGRLIIGDRGSGDTVALTKAGQIRLVEAVGEIDDLSTVDGIAEFISIWRPLVKAPAIPIVLRPNVNVRREWSHSTRATPPSWSFELDFSDEEPLTGNMPGGPFVDPTTGFLAADLGEAAAEWLGIPYFRQYSNPSNRIDVTLIDNRAYLAEMVLDGSTLSIRVHNRNPQQLHCTIVTRDYHDERRRRTFKVSGGTVRTEIALPAKSLDVYLTNDDGYCFDLYQEDTSRPFSRYSLLSSAGARDARVHTELLAAREGGENERVEFKKWLPLDREQPKSFELLRTACAFANSQGGDLFIGVSDELEIVGCAKGLAELARSLKRPRDDCRDQYLQLVRRVIAEGISPTVPTETHWMNHAGLDVLRISIPRTGAVHHVVESNDTYVRRGANSKKATPPEIEALLKTVQAERLQSNPSWVRER